MPESRGRKYTPERKPLPNLRPKPKPKKEWTQFRKLVAVVLGLATLLGVPAAIVVFWPRVTVDILAPENPLNALSAPFVVTNIGIMPLRNVSFSMGVCRITLKMPNGSPLNIVGTPDHPIDPSTPRCATSNGARFATPSWSNHRLAPDERYSGNLADPHTFDAGSNNLISDADISMVVSFRPWVIPWTKEAEFRFVTKPQPDGTLRWFPRSLDNR
jgi:hypothetical protein